MADSVNVLNSKVALPNKLIQDDDTITDITGAPVTEMDPVYETKPALPNKFLNPDGSYSTLNEIIASMVDVSIFVPVTELPETGEENKIYLVPNEKGTFDEYFWNPLNNSWDKIGELDISNLATKDEVTQCLADAKEYANGVLELSQAYTRAALQSFVPLQSMDDYDTIVRNGTTAELMNSVEALELPVGTMLLGLCQLTDVDSIASGMVQEEIKIEMYNNGVIHGVMTSTNVVPYEWIIQWYTGEEFWRPAVTNEVVQNMIDDSVGTKLTESY